MCPKVVSDVKGGVRSCSYQQDTEVKKVTVFNPLTSLGPGDGVEPLASSERFACVRVENLREGRWLCTSFHTDALWKGERLGEIEKVTRASDAEETGQREMAGEEEHGVLEGELGFTGV